MNQNFQPVDPEALEGLNFILQSTSLSVPADFTRLPARFSRHIVVDEATGCWNWNAWIAANYKYPKHRYGCCKYVDATGKRRSTSAHRYAYICINGPVADELDVDHLCHNKLCVNPSHLEAVSHVANRKSSSMTLSA